MTIRYTSPLAWYGDGMDLNLSGWVFLAQQTLVLGLSGDVVGDVRQVRKVEEVVIVMTTDIVVVVIIAIARVMVEISIFAGLQQDVAVSLHQYPMLAIDDHATTPSKWSASHFQEFCRRIGCEHEVLVGSYEHVDQRKRSGEDHPVGHDR